MLYGGKAAVCSYNHREYCQGKTKSLLMLNMVLHMVKNGLQRVKIRKWNTSFTVNRNLTFRGPCIVTYSYNKTNEMH
jgi:hypothetical protein